MEAQKYLLISEPAWLIPKISLKLHHNLSMQNKSKKLKIYIAVTENDQSVMLLLHTGTFGRHKGNSSSVIKGCACPSMACITHQQRKPGVSKLATNFRMIMGAEGSDMKGIRTPWPHISSRWEYWK